MGVGPTGHDGRNLFLYRWLQIRRTRWRRCILRTIRYQEVVQAPGYLNIYSDSQAAIKSIYSTNTNSRTIADCHRSLHEMAIQFTISLIWVSCQRDNVGNCIADELAMQGTTKPLLPGEKNVGMPMATCKLIIKNYFNTLANTFWQNAPQCRISHQAWPVISNKKSSELLKLSRTEFGMLIRALTGHWLVGPHAGRLKAPKSSS